MSHLLIHFPLFSLSECGFTSGKWPSASLSPSPMVFGTGEWRIHGPWGGGGRHICSKAPTCSPFLPTESYQQGVLSATLLYEILLGKATVYAVLVSALVLMAMVRRGAGWAGSLEVTLKTQQLRARSIGTLPGPEVGRKEEGLYPQALEDALYLQVTVGEL